MENFQSHGFLTLHVDRAGNRQFEYRMYQRADGTFALLGGTTTVERLRAAAGDITSYVEQSVELFKLIYDEQKIETMNPPG